MASGDLSLLKVPAQDRLVSIVLPVYNGEDYLAESLDSVLAQSYAGFELIVVDDGSDDGTAKIAASYAAHDARIRVLSQSNQRLPRALSNGFRVARGEFLTWTSADNRMKHNFLERMVTCLRRYPSWDMIYANEDLIDAQGRPCLDSSWYPLYQRPLNSHHLYLPTDPSSLNVQCDNFVGGAFMYRARVRFLLGDYDSSWQGLEDYDYWMRVNALLTLKHSDFSEPLYEYRIHPHSLTGRDESRCVADRAAARLAADVRRRDFYLQPLTWDIDPEAHEECRRLADEASAMTARSSTVGVLSIYMKIARACDAELSPHTHLPDRPFTVLLVVGDCALPEIMPGDWDLCAAWSNVPAPSRLEKDRQGWIVTRDLPALLAAIDVRARSDYLMRPQPANPDRAAEV